MSIQGQLLEVTVVGCSKLKDTEWISRQDPYVFLEYATTKFRTRTCTDGGRNPSFQEKTAVSLIDGLREISVSVWNSNTLSHDHFIGSGRVQLHKVLSEGYDDSSWPIQSRSGKYAGDVKLIMHFAIAGKAQKPGKSAIATGYSPTAPLFNPAPQYAAPYMPSKTIDCPPYPPPVAYPPAGYPPVAEPAAPYQTAAIYPPPPPQQRQYAPTPTYPPVQTYPPQPYPPPQPGQCYPPVYPGVYPPPPPPPY